MKDPLINGLLLNLKTEFNVCYMDYRIARIKLQSLRKLNSAKDQTWSRLMLECARTKTKALHEAKKLHILCNWLLLSRRNP